MKKKKTIKQKKAEGQKLTFFITEDDVIHNLKIASIIAEESQFEFVEKAVSDRIKEKRFASSIKLKDKTYKEREQFGAKRIWFYMDNDLLRKMKDVYDFIGEKKLEFIEKAVMERINEFIKK
jgi:hypothetical protein